MTETTKSGASLPGKTVRELRARAHALRPVVWIAGQGVSESILREIDRSLEAHELIKVHASVDGRKEREALLDEICEALSASPVQIIGKMLVVFRPGREEKPAAPAPARKSPATARGARPAASARARPAKSRTRTAAPPRKSSRKRTSA
jgi:putative YhbY family RNA-binding protein